MYDTTCIAITGLAHSGKDTLRDYIAENLVTNNKRDNTYICFPLDFAGPLKRAAGLLTYTSYDYFYNAELKNVKLPGWDFSARELLVKLGTDFCRNQIDKDFFVKRAKLELENELNFNPETVINADLRFDNEAQFLKDNFKRCVIVKIERPNNPLLAKVDTSNVTEQGINPKYIDFVFTNNKLHDLKAAARFLVKYLEL